MRLEINGEDRRVPDCRTIRELLQNLGIRPDRIAVELNRRIVKRGEWDSTTLKESDKIEIVQFVGGG